MRVVFTPALAWYANSRISLNLCCGVISEGKEAMPVKIKTLRDLSIYMIGCHAELRQAMLSSCLVYVSRSEGFHFFAVINTFTL